MAGLQLAPADLSHATYCKGEDNQVTISECKYLVVSAASRLEIRGCGSCTVYTYAHVCMDVMAS